MIKFFTCIFLATLCFFSHAQISIGINGGLSNYEGDLDDQLFKPLRPAIGITAGYEISDRFSIRAGATLARVAGADRYGKTEFQVKTRNLSFESTIKELSLVGELNIFNGMIQNVSPYIMGGIAVFQFNPYTYTATGEKVFLKPLSTEGQELSGYPNRKSYALTQPSVPLGAGFKYAVTDNIQVGLEIGIRKLFTDYLDDISTTYIDPVDLLQARGQLAVDLSYRGDEVPGETETYPDNGYARIGAPRGSPKGKDWYYFSLLHLSFKLNNGGGNHFLKGSRSKYGCPSNPM